MDKLHDKLRPPRVPRGGGGPAWQQEPGGPPISGAPWVHAERSVVHTAFEELCSCSLQGAGGVRGCLQDLQLMPDRDHCFDMS